jgi:hypothetical protein
MHVQPSNSNQPTHDPLPLPPNTQHTVMGASYDVGDQWSRIQDAIGSATTVFALLDRKPRMTVKPLLGEEGVVVSVSESGEGAARWFLCLCCVCRWQCCE